MRILTAALAASLVLAACSSAPEEAPSPSPEPTTEASSPSPSPTPDDAFPLTGVTTDDPLDDQPVVAVKIENTPSAYPLAGIDRADVVYEQIVEGGVTRFAALFHSDLPERVGPVRSGRFVDVPLLAPWRPVFVYSGARGEVTSALRDAPLGLVVDNGSQDGPIFYRDPGRPGSHDLLADLTTAIESGRELEDVQPVPDSPLTFDEQAPDGGVEQPEFEVAMTSSNRTGWSWDEADGVYRRLRGGEPLPITDDGEVGAASVVLVVASIGQGGCCDTAGNPFTVTQLEGSGDAIVWRDGQRFEVRWTKDGDGEHLQLETADGDPFPLAVGPSWWHLASSSAVPAAPEPTADATDTTSPTATETD